MAPVSEHRVTAITSVAAPCDLVWQVLCDLGRYGEWIEYTLEVRDADPVAQLGATYVERARLSGVWTAVVRWTVVEFEPPNRLVLAGSGVRAVRDLTLELEVQPADDGTEVASTYSYANRFGVLGALLEFVVRGNVVADQKRSLRTLAMLVEAEPA